MQSTLIITKGNRRNRDNDGCTVEVEGSPLCGHCTVYARSDGTTGVMWDGEYYPIEADRAVVQRAVADVYASGQAARITVGRPEAEADESRTSQRDAREARRFDATVNEGGYGYNPYR